MISEDSIKYLYENTKLSVNFILHFDDDWTKVTEKLKKSRVNLSMIPLTAVHVKYNKRRKET